MSFIENNQINQIFGDVLKNDKKTFSFFNTNDVNNKNDSIFVKKNMENNNKNFSFFYSKDSTNDNSLFKDNNNNQSKNNKLSENLFSFKENNNTINDNEMLFNTNKNTISKNFSRNENSEQYDKLKIHLNNISFDGKSKENIIFNQNESDLKKLEFNLSNNIKDESKIMSLNKIIYDKNSRTNEEEQKNNNDNKIINENNMNNIKYILNEQKKIPEKDFHLSESEELKEYEKNNLLNKTNNEIIEELKNKLYNQQQKFKKLTENTRAIESKIHKILKKNIENQKFYEENGYKENNLIKKIDEIDENSGKLKKEIILGNNEMSDVILYYKKNLINSNLFNTYDFDKFKFCEEIIDINGKLSKIESDIKLTEESLNKKRKKISDEINYDDNGIWIKRDNNKKIFLSQNEMNSLLNECYEGLINLKNTQEIFDLKYDILKKTLVNN